MMNCEKYLYLIDDLVEGELAEQTAGQADSHAFACPKCREQYETLKREKEIYAHYLFDVEPAKDLWTSFQTRLESEKEKTFRAAQTPANANARLTKIFGFLRSSPAFPAMACAALLLVFGIGFSLLKFSSEETSMDKYVAETELVNVRSPAESLKIDKMNSADSPAKSKSGENNAAPKIAVRGGKIESKSKNVSFVKKSIAAEALKSERKTVSVPAGKNPAGAANRLSEKERLQSAQLKNLEKEIAGQIEKVELLLRSFRNARAVENIETFDVEYEKGQARRLLEKNVRLRRNAESYGISSAEELLSRVEPYLLDIANLESNPMPDKVLDIRERVKNQNIIASLQIY